MRAYMRKLTPEFGCDTAVVQAWLEDEAACGNLLHHQVFFLGYCVFEKGAPAALRYRLEAAGEAGGPDQERQEVCRAMGWEYVCAIGRFWVWRCADPEAVEFSTDPQTQAAGLQRVRRRMRNTAFLLLLLNGRSLWGLYQAFSRPGWMAAASVKSRPLWTILALAAILAAFLVQMAASWLSDCRLLRRLRLGLPQPHRKPYKTARRLALLSIAALVMVVAVLVHLIYLDNAGYDRSALLAEAPYIPLAQLDPAYDGSGQAEAVRIPNWLVQEHWEISENCWNGQASTLRDGSPNPAYRAEGYPRCFVHYFRAGFLAEPLLESLLEYLTAAPVNNGPAVEMTPIDCPGLDGAYCGARDGGAQFLLVRRGGQVMEVVYSGGEDLRAHLPEYAALLENR